MPAVHRRHADLRHQRGDRRQHGAGWGDLRCIAGWSLRHALRRQRDRRLYLRSGQRRDQCPKGAHDQSFTITVSDGTLSASQTFTIAINGTNDAAIISGSTAGSVSEAGGVANATLGTTTATGTLTDTDVDDAPNTFTAVTSPTSKRRRLRHLHDDGGWRVDLHAQQRQRRGAGAQCRRHADRHLHGDHRRRHPAGGDDHHQRHQRRGHHFRRHDRLGDRGRRLPSPGTPTATGTLTDTDVDNPPNTFTAVARRRRAPPATAPSR